MKLHRRGETRRQKQEHSRAAQKERKYNCPCPKAFHYRNGCVHIFRRIIFAFKEVEKNGRQKQEHSRAAQTGRKCNCPYPKVFLYIKGCVHMFRRFFGVPVSIVGLIV